MELLARIDRLVRLKATGTPAELAERIGVSERHLYRVIQKYREIGLPIEYNKKRQCYCYTESVKLWIEVQVGEEILLKVKGGKKIIDFFEVTDGFWQ